MAGTFSEWSPLSSYVQAGLVDGQYAHAAFTMLAAGPPRLANIGGAAALAGAISSGGAAANQIVMPMGLIQNVALGHTRNFSRIFEVGSDRSYFIAGRTLGQLGIGRAYYHGASLLRILYAFYQDLVPPTLVQAMFTNVGATTVANPHDVIIPPGYENLYFNLASDLFAQPIGVLIYQRDINGDALGAGYLEACYVPNHGLQTDSQGVLLMENASIQFERMVPVQISALALITSETSSNAGGANQTFPGLPG